MNLKAFMNLKRRLPYRTILFNKNKEYKIHSHFFLYLNCLPISNNSNKNKMKKILLLSVISIYSLAYSQVNCEALKKENENLQSTNKILGSENEYLKKVLDINKPILETEKENSSFKITKVVGNKTEKSIAISFLIEAKDEKKKMTIEDVFVVDIEGNEYKIDLYKSSKPYPELALNVPVKLTFSFKDIQGEPLFIKIFRFKTTSQHERNTFEKTKSNLEFRDIKVVWN
ncbi:Uncharacterised protein [Chryseobacterium carnipullorum]|uniref:Uncharacterized protein n=2 Tax=Chryseobacterium carnipullorum TaxID=1124835 RepID=A0A376EDV1_CHRCU|nr:Uncharacterised protein [Chryseobacterium carnipullorum]